MEKELLPRENNPVPDLSIIILCAGEGTRLKKITKTLPKPLIKIELLNNISILDNSITDLLKIGVNQIALVIGHLGQKIRAHITSIKEGDLSLRDKILIIDSENQYKLGPLYSFLSITKYETFFNNHNYYILIPGDTIFDFNILEEILLTIMKLIKTDDDYSCIFYRNIEVKELKRYYEIYRTVSIGQIEKSGSLEILKKFIITNLKEIALKIKINQIIPIIALSYKTINDLLLLNSEIPSKTLWESLNLYIEKGNTIRALKIESNSNFYDIDSEVDLKFLKKRKKGQ